MKAVRALFIVLFNVAVVAPAAASPRVSAATWPGVSDVLLNVAVAAPVATWPRIPVAAWPVLNDSHVLGMGTPSKTAAWGCTDPAGILLRLVAEWREFDSDDVGTTHEVPGISLYTKTVSVPDGCDTLYVTFGATGEEAVGTWFSCNVDGNFCNPGTTAGSICSTTTCNPDRPGWIALQYLPRLVLTNPPPAQIPIVTPDNGIYYTWCTPIIGGQDHVVEIRMASVSEGTFSGIEGEHFFIDASYTGGGCVKAAPATR